MIDDPEEFAWQQLEAKQNKTKSTPITDRFALQIAHSALSAIDNETPYPIAKHSLAVINEVLSRPVQDWEAIAGNQAMTIAILRDDLRQALSQPEQVNSIWVLTREINEYDQDGEYFVSAWNNKPTHQMLTEMGVYNVLHVLNGGGRVGYENEWFYLKEIKHD